MSTPATTDSQAEAIDPQAVIDELTGTLRNTAADVVPWFLSQMPLMYFQDTDNATRLSHLRAIIAAKASGRPIELSLRSEDSSQWTLMRPMDYPGVLAEIVAQLPVDRPLRAAKIHTAGDGALVLDTFEFGEAAPFDPEDPAQAAILERTIEYARDNRIVCKPDEIEQYCRQCTAEYVNTVTPLRFCSHLRMYRQVSGTDSTVVDLEPEADPNQSRITVAVGNSTTRVMLERIATRLSHSSINIHRAYLDIVNDEQNGSISLLGFVVQSPDGGAIDPDSELWSQVRQDILRIKWFDRRTLELTYRQQKLRLDQADILMGLCNLSLQAVIKRNPYAFVLDRMIRRIERYLDIAIRIADLFIERFDPDQPLTDSEFTKRSILIHGDIDTTVDTESARITMHTLVDAIAVVLRTNLYLDGRYALALRIDPVFLKNDDRPEIPYGVFFMHGRGFNGFHVRFQDIARGGLRVIKTTSFEQHGREMERLYDEVYGLAFAQHLKNKDIPEGGSKAAVLLDPGVELDRCVKAFVNSVLDLITPDEEVQARIVDRFGHRELLYLGPDENVTTKLIEWIVDRAKRRAYPMPNAFMSSKPGAGINHKVYGVTSEGVNVFLDVALQSTGIDPTAEPFTIKLTGGPDGDVAGNMIRILVRDYGDNAKIVGIADGSGCGEDPEGLNHQELLRLVELAAPIDHYDRSKLGPRGRIIAIDDPEGVQMRNTFHFRVLADAFVPAGGRPNTIHRDNWKNFFVPDGSPSSPVIVEGANLFLTPEARVEISDRGVLIIKDSSANKCGVICSSFEIIASMVLTDEEFLRIKPRYVEEVLSRLRSLARLEAVLLMNERKRHPEAPLPETSTRVSRNINRAAAAIEASLAKITEQDQALTRELVIEHLPPILVETAGDRLWESMPTPYLNWTISKSLAARIVYREGVEFFESLPLGAISDLAMRYLRQDLETRRLVDLVRNSNLADKNRIAKLLSRAGTRAGLLDIDAAEN